MATSSQNSVDAIFQRAERVFERRVDQLLLAKRAKAAAAGTPFNARKAKRDARTVAGREKLDALVRRLADLAIAQEAILNNQSNHQVNTSLQGAAAAILAISACVSENQDQNQSLTNISITSPDENIDDTIKSNSVDRGTDFPNNPSDTVKDLFDTSSCSDDCYEAMPLVPNLKDTRDGSDNDDKEILSAISLHSASKYINQSNDNNNLDYISNSHSRSRTLPSSCMTNTQPTTPVSRCVSAPVSHAPLFEATESVVNFVLQCDEDDHEHANMNRIPPPTVAHGITASREYVNAMESARAIAQSQWHSTSEEYSASY